MHRCSSVEISQKAQMIVGKDENEKLTLQLTLVTGIHLEFHLWKFVLDWVRNRLDLNLLPSSPPQKKKKKLPSVYSVIGNDFCSMAF